MKLAIATLAAIAATASAQCTVNPEFNAAIQGTSTTTNYEYIGTGTAVEYPSGTGNGYPGSTNIATGLYAAGHSFLIAHSSSVDGNNPTGSMDAADLVVSNYDTFKFSTDSGCFNLADGGVIVADIDHDHDDSVTPPTTTDDDYHDTATVIFELADGSKVAGVSMEVNAANAPFGVQIVTDPSPTGPQGAATGLVEGVTSVDGIDATVAMDNLPYANTDVCGTMPCQYSENLQRNARIFKAPVDSEVVGIEIIYFSSTPTDMDNVLSNEAAMAVTLVDNAPSCSAVTCDGTLFENVLCDSPEGCDCVCEVFPQCTASTCDNGTPVAEFQCPSADACECGCEDFPQCTPAADCGAGTPITPFQCPSADACDCGCDEPANPECTPITATCGDVTAEGTSTGKCICLDFEAADTGVGGGAL